MYPLIATHLQHSHSMTPRVQTSQTLPANNPGKRISHPARLKHNVCTQMQRSTVGGTFCPTVQSWRWCAGVLPGERSDVALLLHPTSRECRLWRRTTQLPTGFSLVARQTPFAPCSVHAAQYLTHDLPARIAAACLLPISTLHARAGGPAFISWPNKAGTI